MIFLTNRSALFALGLSCVSPALAETINVDFSRDISGSNPGGNSADVVATTAGIAPDTGTVWNDFSVKMVSDLIPANYALPNLVNSTGAATTVTVTLTNNASSVWFRAFNSTIGTANNISREWVFGNDPTLPGIITVSGLAAGGTYDFYLVGGATFATNFTIGANTEGTTNGSGQSNISLWVEGTEYVKMTGVADGSGNIAIRVKGNGQLNGTIAAMQIVGNSAPPANAIVSFASSAPFAQKPALPTLTWEVTGDITSLQLGNSEQGVIDVTGMTTSGIGSLLVSPLGDQSYTLTLNGTITATLNVVGLPPREKLHIYLLMGQSNMQGASGDPVLNDGTHDPVPRIIKFGSRVGMEQQFVTGGHPLTSLSSQSGNGVSAIGMGLEFAKTLLAAETDPEVVICLINHALGSTAIQYWQPDAIAQDGTKLYNNAIQRTLNAANFGVVKGVLWHQGEYNCNASQTNPPPEPELYDDYLNDLVDNVRDVFNNQGLPFICGKLSPNHPFSGDRTTVEAALSGLHGQRSNTFCVDNNGLSGKVGETIHFDENSQLLLGQRYAAAMLGFYGNPFLLHMGAYLNPAQLANPLLTDPSGDNDADGTSNYLEFAFLTNPMNRETTPSCSGGVIAVPPGGEFPTLSFRKRSDTEAPPYIIEVSDNMRTWTSNLDGGPPVTETVGAPVTNGDGTSTVTVRSLAPIGPANPRQFLRLAVPSN